MKTCAVILVGLTSILTAAEPPPEKKLSAAQPPIEVQIVNRDPVRVEVTNAPKPPSVDCCNRATLIEGFYKMGETHTLHTVPAGRAQRVIVRYVYHVEGDRSKYPTDKQGGVNWRLTAGSGYAWGQFGVDNEITAKTIYANQLEIKNGLDEVILGGGEEVKLIVEHSGGVNQVALSILVIDI